MNQTTPPDEAVRIINALCRYIATPVGHKRPENSLDPAEALAKLNQLLLQAEDTGFKEGQRVGQHQAADKLYHHTTMMWLFKDDLSNPVADLPTRIHDMNKDCEKFLNHNSKVYTAYVRGDRYKRLHPESQLTVREQL